MTTEKIYVIMWRGRDCDSGVWDDYPCHSYGWYADETVARKLCDKMNEAAKRVDPTTGENEYFFAQGIDKSTDEIAKNAIKDCENFYTARN